MKKTLINILCVAIALLSGISLFILKYQVKEQERLLQTIHRDILRHKREIHMLEAEWAHLNDPQRLLDLVKSQTTWETISAKQISTLSEIPLRPELLPAEPEVINTQETVEQQKENPVVKEVVPIESVSLEKKNIVSSTAPQQNQSEKNNQPVIQKSTVASKPKGSVQGGVWKPAAKTARQGLQKPAVKTQTKASTQVVTSKPKSSPAPSESVRKGSAALSALVNKEGRR